MVRVFFWSIRGFWGWFKVILRLVKVILGSIRCFWVDKVLLGLFKELLGRKGPFGVSQDTLWHQDLFWDCVWCSLVLTKTIWG